MSLKQDRQPARTVPDLERKYNFGQAFAEILGIATDARKFAEQAKQEVGSLDDSLTSDEIFDRLTGGGTAQGIYRENGEIFINASFIKTGFISSDLIKAGKIRSLDFEATEAEMLYPGTLYPDVALYPNNGEEIIRGMEIDFEEGVIRGALYNEVEDEDHPGCFYRMVNGVTEWLNPPMVAGTEYRTAERFMGSPVFTTLVNIGYVTRGDNSFAHNLSVRIPISLDVINNDRELLTDYSGITNLTADATNIYFSCPNNFGNIRVILKYVK